MRDLLMETGMPFSLLADTLFAVAWNALWPYLLIFAGFSAVIFVHELGHFMAAKWADVVQKSGAKRD